MNRGNPAMLELARELRSLNQLQLAEQLGLSQGAVSRLENGTLPLSNEIVSNLSRVLHFPEAFFFQECDYRNLPLTFFRKRARVPASAIRAVRARTCLFRLHVRILLKSADVPVLRVPLIDSRERRGDVEAIANDVRLQWSLPPGPVANLTRTMEDAGVIVSRCEFGTAQIDALSSCESDGLPPLVFVNPVSPGDRLRFSLAHELGHIVLHHHLNCPAEADTEGEADRFAAEFLMPKQDIRGHFARKLTLEAFAQMKSYWKVSIQALIRRARSLDRITERYERTLYMQMSKYGYRKNEPVIIPAEEPTLFRELIQFHLTELEYSRADLARALHIEPSDLRALHTDKVAELRSVKPQVTEIRNLG